MSYIHIDLFMLWLMFMSHTSLFLLRMFFFFFLTLNCHSSNALFIILRTRPWWFEMPRTSHDDLSNAQIGEAQASQGNHQRGRWGHLDDQRPSKTTPDWTAGHWKTSVLGDLFLKRKVSSHIYLMTFKHHFTYFTLTMLQLWSYVISYNIQMIWHDKNYNLIFCIVQSKKNPLRPAWSLPRDKVAMKPLTKLATQPTRQA